MRVALGSYAFLQNLDKGWRVACQEVHDFIDQQIERGLKNLPTDGNSNAGLESNSQQFNLLNELLKKSQDREYLRFQLLNIFLPARDSTAIAISNVFFHLARHSRVWDKLRTEVSKSNGDLTFESLKQMKYVRFVVNESKLNSSANFMCAG